MNVKYIYLEYAMYYLQGLLDRCTSMGKGMGPCLYIAHVYVNRIVPMLGIYVYEGWIYEHLINMMCMNVHSDLAGLYERIAYIVMPIDSCIDICTCVT